MNFNDSKTRVIRYMENQKPPLEIKILQLVGKSLLTILLGLGVSYLRNIGKETAQLNLGIVELKTELKAISFHQNEINNDIRKQIDRLNDRIDRLEERIKP